MTNDSQSEPSLLESADLSSDLSSPAVFEPSGNAKPTPTPPPSCESTGPQSPTSETSPPLTGPEWSGLTLFAEDSPASPSALPVDEWLVKMPDGSGPSSHDAFANSDPDTRCWKTSQASLPLFERVDVDADGAAGKGQSSDPNSASGTTDSPRKANLELTTSNTAPLAADASTDVPLIMLGSIGGPHRSKKSLVTWPRSGSMRNGVAYRRQPWVRRISGGGSSFWPTPVAHDDGKTPEAHMAMKARMKGGPRRTPTSLTVVVKGVEAGLWPTPTVQDASNDGGPSQFERNTLPLNAAVKMWRTPQAGDGNGGGQEAERRQKAGHSVYLRDQMKSAEGSGQLNPDWVEALMGFPIGWTDLTTLGRLVGKTE